MDFDWSKPFSEDVEGDLPNIHIGSDKLDRGKYAEFLTDFLSSLDNQNYVMNLNAEWGAGKTYFLQRWYHTIKEDHPAVYIDAWKHDFSDEPLLAVISAISNYLKSKTPESGAEKAKNLAEKGWRFSKKVAPELMRGITKKVSGIDITKFGDDEVQTISDLKYDGSDTNGAEDFSLFAGKVFEVALADHSEKVNELEFFKNAIQGWLKEVVDSNDELDLPMFVFIDELDRCRPTYAIELLETVKHLFDIKGMVFVIATDTGQLQHSIKAVYGEGFNSVKYLYRFFSRSFSLKKPSLREYIKSHPTYEQYLSKVLLNTCDESLLLTEQQLLTNLTNLASVYDFDLRTTGQWLERLWASINTENKRKKYVWIYIALTSALQISSRELYEKLFVNQAVGFSANSHDSMDFSQSYGSISNRMNNLNLSLEFGVVHRSVSGNFIRRYERETISLHFNHLLQMSKLFYASDLHNVVEASNSASNVFLKRLYSNLYEVFKIKGQDYMDLIDMASDLT
ncbi:KAP family P-loop NTPase fold protein [Bacterioplanoides sp.]|uniref:KAP family P-loop NTPase fold protein n=1 Tax=Bacterioplanoides sp. TaxID=2066072 RepID=UPI003B5A08A4